MNKGTGKVRTRLDFTTLLGLAVGFGGVVGGLALEGGKLADIGQVTGAVIVLGGTLGAVLITTPLSSLKLALRSVKLLYFEVRQSPSAIVDDLIEFGNRARRNGIVSLEQDVENIPDPFLRKALSLGVDGTDLQDLREAMELELDLEEEEGRKAAKVYESAGGYAPTIGIIGAVLGLIQVMKHLDNIQEVGQGIAVAFVATIYGVGSANLLFLPAAGKIRSRYEESARMKRLMLEGVCGIVQGLHPKIIERRLEAYLGDERHSLEHQREGRSRAGVRAASHA